MFNNSLSKTLCSILHHSTDSGIINKHRKELIPMPDHGIFEKVGKKLLVKDLDRLQELLEAELEKE